MKVEERTAAAGAHTPFGLLVPLCCLSDPGGVGGPSSSPEAGIPWDTSSHLHLWSPGPVSADLNLRLAAGLSWEAGF